MTSFLVIGDPHFKVSNVKETDRMVEAIINIAKKKSPDIIVVLGDVLDRHETIHVSPLTRSITFLKLLSEISPTYLLIGNHDLKNNRQFLSDEHPFLSLKFWGKNLEVVDTTKLLSINDKIFVFVPYVPPGKFIEALNMCPGWENSRCIFAHQEFKGAKMGAITSVEGDDWSLTNPFVISGHIHDYQEPQTNILYTGTPIQHAFGDRHDKTISFFIFEENSKNFSHERIDLGLPKKRIVYLACSEVSTYIPDINAELKIIIRGKSGEIKAIMKHPNIELWTKNGYKIIYKDLPTENSKHIIINNEYVKFSNILYSKIHKNEKLKILYEQLFGENEKIELTNPKKKIILNIS